jgi:hypothetical protein
MLNLKDIVKKSQEGFDSISDPTIVLSLSKFEQYVNEAYEGRLFFELIQNARDAAFQKGINSDIKISVKDKNVLFANTGKPFDEKGVLAMTRLGLSDKTDNGLIGNKGIGFKAIQEFTKRVKIITEFGTFYFDREELKNKLNEKFPDLFDKELSIPLFYYPHYENRNIQQIVDFEIYDTIIDFELNKNKTGQNITELYRKITDEELVLLGNINSIDFESDDFLKKRLFSYDKENFIEVDNDGVIKRFKVFSAENSIAIPDEIFEELDENDRKLFETDRSIDIRLVFEYSDKNTIVKRQDSRLFLYYPLETVSGFPYIIHSNFSCNPERTSIRDTRLNEYLFDQITTLQTTQILDYLTANDFREKLVDFLYFERAKGGKLETFYEMYIDKLVGKKFIWIKDLNNYVSTDEIVFCPKEIYSFLKNHKVDDKYLYTCEEPIKSFLIDNFQVVSLTKKQIFNHIEEFCRKEVVNPTFFNRLYSICISNDINVSNKKVLLGSNNQLYSGEDDVFYISNKSNLKIPNDINSKLVVLHPNVKIKYEDLNKGSRLLGFNEFRTHDIVEKALRLFDDGEVNNHSIIFFLFGLKDLTQQTKDAIYKGIYLPIKGSMNWIQPIYNPMYFDIPTLRELYPDGYFLDIESFFEFSDNESKWDSFFSEYGVWKIPAMYYSKESVNTTGDGNRTSKINNRTNKSAYGFEVRNDRNIDFPNKPNYFFYQSIFSNWNFYFEKIMNQSILSYRVKSTIATYLDNIVHFADTTSFVTTLLNNPWIYLSEDQPEPYSVDDIIGLNRLDYSIERSLNKNLRIYPIDFQQNRSFVETFNISHFNAFTTKHIVSILNKIYLMFNDKEGEVLETDFKRFYHTVLKYLYNTYNQFTIENDRVLLINKLKSTVFLCQQVNDNKEFVAWKVPNQIYYIDEKSIFDLMPKRFIEALQFYFTKSDKNEIGKIFSRIGKKLSSEVTEQVVISDNENECFFIEIIENLPYLIAAVEDKNNEHLTDKDFSTLKQMKLIYNSGLKRQISLKSNDKYIEDVHMNFFFYEKENLIYVSDVLYPIKNDKSILGEIINEVFNSLVPRELDLSRLFRDLLHSKTSLTFSRALKDVEYDEERIVEIESIFGNQKLTPKQLFWDAILFAKQTESYESAFAGSEEVDFNIIDNHINADLIKIGEWDANLDYLQLSSSSNFPIIKEVLEIENLSIDQINEKLELPIDFDYLYRQEFNKYKNSNLNKIKILLFSHFSEQAIAEKEKFHENIIAFEKQEPQKWNREFVFNVTDDLLNLLNQKFKNLNLKIEDINSSDEASWKKLQSTIPQKMKKLRELLKKLEVEMDFFQDFAIKETTNSLLFFDDYDELIGRYAKLYPKGDEETDNEQLLNKTFEPAEEDNKTIIVYDVKGNSLADNANAFENELRKFGGKSGSKGNGGSGGNPNLPNQDYLKHIGQEGERLLFLKLSKLYNGNVTWASENAVCMGFVPDKEAVGYDIRFIDKNNETHYVEVKTSTHQEPEFHISINEIRAARKYGEYYHVYWITNIFDAQSREYYDLKNMFINFEEGQDFFHNNKYYPQLTGFKIVFKADTLQPLQVASNKQ